MGLRVLGIDPGLGTTGYAVVDADGKKYCLDEAGIIRAPADRSLADRLAVLFTDITEILREFHVDAVSLEDLYSHYRHPTTAIKMGHARGVMVLAASLQGVEVFTYGATRIKKSLTGNGHASKAQVQEAVRRYLGLATTPKPADVADAVAAALCHIDAAGRPGKVFAGRRLGKKNRLPHRIRKQGATPK